jgi:anti-sigma factor RsiW
MARPSDEKLIAYFDGALDPAERDVVARWLEHDLAVRLRGAALGETRRCCAPSTTRYCASRCRPV